jgi:predicted small secreted protein
MNNFKNKDSIATTCKENFKETVSIKGSQIFVEKQCLEKTSFGL